MTYDRKGQVRVGTTLHMVCAEEGKFQNQSEKGERRVEGGKPQASNTWSCRLFFTSFLCIELEIKRGVDITRERERANRHVMSVIAFASVSCQLGLQNPSGRIMLTPFSILSFLFILIYFFTFNLI